MERLAIMLGLLAVVVMWHRFMYRQSNGRTQSPLWMAFSTTTVAILFITAGATGYRLSHGIPFTVASAWSGKIIWSQIGVGAGVAVLAAYFWRLGLRSLRTSQ
jgi:uncharacterized membrane protein YhdT